MKNSQILYQYIFSKVNEHFYVIKTYDSFSPKFINNVTAWTELKFLRSFDDFRNIFIIKKSTYIFDRMSYIIKKPLFYFFINLNQDHVFKMLISYCKIKLRSTRDS